MGVRVLDLLLFVAMAATVQPPDSLTHPGVVIDVSDGKPIPGAQATAYAAELPGANGPCPRHQTELHATSTGNEGDFKFSIRRAYPSYFAMYCANSFQSRPVAGNENLYDNTRVRQDPIKLYPARARLTSKGLEPVDVARRAIVRVLDDATGDLKYFRSADPGGFDAAIGLLGENSQKAATLLLQREPAARPRDLGSGPPDVSIARRAVGMVLASAADDLRYFNVAAPDDVPTALRSLATRDSSIVNILMTPLRGVAAAE